MRKVRSTPTSRGKHEVKTNRGLQAEDEVTLPAVPALSVYYLYTLNTYAYPISTISVQIANWKISQPLYLKNGEDIMLSIYHDSASNNLYIPQFVRWNILFVLVDQNVEKLDDLHPWS